MTKGNLFPIFSDAESYIKYMGENIEWSNKVISNTMNCVSKSNIATLRQKKTPYEVYF